MLNIEILVNLPDGSDYVVDATAKDLLSLGKAFKALIFKDKRFREDMLGRHYSSFVVTVVPRP